MNDNNSSLDPFYSVDNDNHSIDIENSESLHTDNKLVDSRRRLEDRLEQRYLEKDIKEFDFDI